MEGHSRKQPEHLTIRAEHRDDPVSQVTEADARSSSERYPKIVVRGPLFGIAEQRPGDGNRWRLLSDMAGGYPQQARDELNSYLWLKAKDEVDDPTQRRELLDAVALLEKEPVDELTALGVRYRVVRADEFARVGEEGLEPPRPTDPESEGWEPTAKSPSRTRGFVVDHSAAVGLMESLERMALLSVTYTSERFPAEVLEDSRRAVESHPGVVLLPAVFRALERDGVGWAIVGSHAPTPQDVRRHLVTYLRDVLPMLEPLSEREQAECAEAVAEFTSRLRPNELTVLGREFTIVRVERMVRIGPDGPEPPRPSDVDEEEPCKIRPTMDEWGNIHHAADGEDEAHGEGKADGEREDGQDGAGGAGAVPGVPRRGDGGPGGGSVG